MVEIDKTIALVIAAAVLMMAAITVIGMFTGSISDTRETIESTEESSKCEFQTNQASEDSDWNNVDEECINDEYVPEDQEEEAVTAAVKPQIT